MVMISLPFRGHHTEGVGSDETTYLPLLLSWCGLFFVSLFIKKSVLLIFTSFLEIVVLYVVLVWEEVSSGFSYSTILIWTSFICVLQSEGQIIISTH